VDRFTRSGGPPAHNGPPSRDQEGAAEGLRPDAAAACVLLSLNRQEAVMQTLVEIGTMVTGIGVALVAARLVLQGILVVTFGKRG